MKSLDDYNLLALDAETMRDPYPFYHLLLEGAPVYKEPRHGIYIVTRYDDILTMKQQPHRFSNQQPTGPMTLPKLEDLPEDLRLGLIKMMSAAGPDGAAAAARNAFPLPTLLFADPPQHSRYRGMTNKLLNVRRARQWEPRIRAIADELIDAFIEKGDMEFVMDFAHPLPLRTVAEILGVPQGDDKLLDQMFGGPHAGEVIGNPIVMVKRLVAGQDAVVAQPVFQAFFTDRIKELRQRPVEDDFLSELIEMPDANGVRLNDEEILSIITHFQVAGHETSTKMMTQAMYQLINHPDAMAAVRADPSLCENLVEEALRYEAPVQGLFQVAKEDVEIGGVTVPAGSMLMTLYAAANRDPRHFEHPDEFDVHRANARTHLSFGQGIHFCVGSPFARAEGKLGFQAFFARIKDVRFADGKNDFERTVSYVLRGIRELHLEFAAA